MKKRFSVSLAAILAILGYTNLSNANEARLTQLNRQELVKVLWALEVLKKTKTLVQKDNACVDVNPDILLQLESEGFIENDGATIQTICIGPAK